MAQMPETIILRKAEETKTGVTYCMADVKTNADRIRAMTDEELAHLLHTAEEHIFNGNLWNYEQWQTWLKSPVEVQK